MRLYAGTLIILEMPGGPVTWEIEENLDGHPMTLRVRELQSGTLQSIPAAFILQAIANGLIRTERHPRMR
jgi:hypothetical protein